MNDKIVFGTKCKIFVLFSRMMQIFKIHYYDLGVTDFVKHDETVTYSCNEN